MSKRNGNFTTGRNRTAPAWKRQERDNYERRQAGYCEHGVYVGGCGADYMCGRCESGEAPLTKAERKRFDKTKKCNYHLNRTMYFLKRHRWDRATEAYTTANRWNSRNYHTPLGKLVFEAFMAYGKQHDKFKEAAAAA